MGWDLRKKAKKPELKAKSHSRLGGTFQDVLATVAKHIESIVKGKKFVKHAK